MKKKFLSVLAVACVACLSAALLAGCSQQQSSSNDGNPADNKLIVGFDNSYPPYGLWTRTTTLLVLTLILLRKLQP